MAQQRRIRTEVADVWNSPLIVNAGNFEFSVGALVVRDEKSVPSTQVQFYVTDSKRLKLPVGSPVATDTNGRTVTNTLITVPVAETSVTIEVQVGGGSARKSITVPLSAPATAAAPAATTTSNKITGPAGTVSVSHSHDGKGTNTIAVAVADKSNNPKKGLAVSFNVNGAVRTLNTDGGGHAAHTIKIKQPRGKCVVMVAGFESFELTELVGDLALPTFPRGATVSTNRLQALIEGWRLGNEAVRRKREGR